MLTHSVLPYTTGSATCRVMSGYEDYARRHYAHTDLLHVAVATTISKLSANSEIVEVVSPKVFVRGGSQQLERIRGHSIRPLPTKLALCIEVGILSPERMRRQFGAVSLQNLVETTSCLRRDRQIRREKVGILSAVA